MTRQLKFRIACALALTGVWLAVLGEAAAQGRGRGAPPAQTQRRVALVVGNGAYPSTPLRFAENDARDMSQALAKLGFETTLMTDGTKAAMLLAIDRFVEAARSADVALFYFAGHGEQVVSTEGALNYLLPVDVAPGGGQANRGTSVSVLTDLVGRLATGTQNRINIIILDACRTQTANRSPVTGAEMLSTNVGGLARMNLPSGTFVAYGTAPGTFAIESPDSRHGRFTNRLLENIALPGLLIEQTFRRVRSAVEQDSNNQQSPREETALRADQDFYFVPPAGSRISLGRGGVTVLPTPPVLSATPSPVETSDILQRVRTAPAAERFKTLKRIIDTRAPALTAAQAEALLRTFWRSGRPAVFELLISSFPAGMKMQDASRLFAVGMHGVEREDGFLGPMSFDRVVREGKLDGAITKAQLAAAVTRADTEKDRCTSRSTLAEVDADLKPGIPAPSPSNAELMNVLTSNRTPAQRLEWLQGTVKNQQFSLGLAETQQVVRAFPAETRATLVSESWAVLPDLFAWRDVIELLSSMPMDEALTTAGRLSTLQLFIAGGKVDATMTRAERAQLTTLLQRGGPAPVALSSAGLGDALKMLEQSIKQFHDSPAYKQMTPQQREAFDQRFAAQKQQVEAQMNGSFYQNTLSASLLSSVPLDLLMACGERTPVR